MLAHVRRWSAALLLLAPAIALATDPAPYAPGGEAVMSAKAPRATPIRSTLRVIVHGPSVPMPLGCSNLCSEATFLFGSCRGFYGAGGAAGEGADCVGCRRR